MNTPQQAYNAPQQPLRAAMPAPQKAPDAPAAQAPKGALHQMREEFLGIQRCPNCGTPNEPQATFCEHCGQALHDLVCPRCGAVVAPEADFCENCHSYISTDRCSFCYAPISDTDEYCLECGSPRSGIVCPTCHSVGQFGFCERCGTPLTDRARMEGEVAWDVPFAQEVRQLEQQIEKLWRTRPVNSKLLRQHLLRNQELRDRVMELLHADGNDAYEQSPMTSEPPIYKDETELKQELEEKRKALQELLDQMAMPEMNNPAMARNYAMARKPHISKLAWRCNYKNALHPSPLGCACPQHGGQWVILNGKEVNDIHHD